MPPSDKIDYHGQAIHAEIILHQIPRLFTERIVPVDVAMVQVSPPDEHGFMSLGVETMCSRAACQAAKDQGITIAGLALDGVENPLGDCASPSWFRTSPRAGGQGPAGSRRRRRKRARAGSSRCRYSAWGSLQRRGRSAFMTPWGAAGMMNWLKVQLGIIA